VRNANRASRRKPDATRKEPSKIEPLMTRCHTLAFAASAAFTTNFTTKLAGQVVANGTRVMSKDGKTMTLWNKSASGPGESTMVYNRR
jgi:hypothetical protein